MEYHAEHGLGPSFGPLFCFLFWDLVLKKKKGGSLSSPLIPRSSVIIPLTHRRSVLDHWLLQSLFLRALGAACVANSTAVTVHCILPRICWPFFSFSSPWTLAFWALQAGSTSDPPSNCSCIIIAEFSGSVFWALVFLLYILILILADFLTLPVLSLPFFPFSLLLPSIRSPLLFLFRVIVDSATAERGTRVTLSSTPRSTGCRQNAGVPECHRTHSIL